MIGDQKEIKQADFDDKIDIMPVADPNIFSQTQRIATAQTELQLAQSNPQMHNLYEAYRDMNSAIGVKNIDQIIQPPTPPTPNIAADCPAFGFATLMTAPSPVGSAHPKSVARRRSSIFGTTVIRFSLITACR